MALWTTNPPRRVLVVREEHPRALGVAHRSAAMLRVGGRGARRCPRSRHHHHEQGLCIRGSRRARRGTEFLVAWRSADVHRSSEKDDLLGLHSTPCRSWGRGRSRLGPRQHLLHGHPARPLFPWLHQIQIDSPHLRWPNSPFGRLPICSLSPPAFP
jgi:hypothetical protein